VATAPSLSDLPPEWVNGITFLPEQCRAQEPATWWTCPEPGGAEPVDIPTVGAGVKTSGVNPDIVEYRPWAAHASEICTTLSHRSADQRARVQRLLLADESRQIAQELWNGTVAINAAFPNNYLRNTADPVYADLTPGAGSAPLAQALMLLQDAIADAKNGRGMIHATPSTVSLWHAAALVRREGQVFLDAMDNFVVADAGYDGSDPAGVVDPANETRYAYATSVVYVNRDAIIVNPRDEQAAIDRDINDVEWRAERFVSALWDGCVHLAINVNLCETCCAAGGLEPPPT
jgi:hypothetical protein